MKNSFISPAFLTGLLCAGLAVFSFGGCKIIPEAAVDSTRYFVLNGPVTTDLAVSHPTGTHQIGLRPVELPGYLRNHKDMVVRTGANELRFQEFALWAEPLDAGVNRVLKERLLSTETIGGVTTYPFSIDIKRDYDVVVRILNCEGLMQRERGGVARFAAAYDIIATGAGGQVVVRRTFTAPDQAWDGENYAALARLLSEAVAKLSADIAANLPK
ncbi:MAG: membrane integrity-associated transporter subunit PqiC [Verrucomicrobia bacterium]|nr:membrane integrity-associated transporter subunit PqiC [Verrucomicrobiota bacterium]